MKTDGAWIYLCKECGCYHFVPYQTFENKNPKDYEVSIVCPKEKKGYLYDGKYFKSYLGDYWTILNNIVEPSSIYMKEAKIKKMLVK